MKIRPNDFCYCNSGKKYKDCHMIRDNYKPEKRLSFDKKDYIEKWKADSKYFCDAGYYKWMADILFEKIHPRYILDIGCGMGYGIIELLRNITIEQIICIEENEFCIDAAKDTIEKNGYDIKTIKSNTSIVQKNGYYINEYSEIDEIDGKQKVIIIQGDIYCDEILQEFLKKIRFDAVTCWLLGTHQSMQNNLAYQNLYQSNLNFRLVIQNRIYELSDIILNKDGILQMIDRGGLPYDERSKNSYLDSHKEQASVTSLNVIDLKYIEYKNIHNGVPMSKTVNYIDENNPNPNAMALICAFSKK
jgi:SAM-dependent methyltransferase